MKQLVKLIWRAIVVKITQSINRICEDYSSEFLLISFSNANKVNKLPSDGRLKSVIYSIHMARRRSQTARIIQMHSLIQRALSPNKRKTARTK